jgi:hypothetical protein
MLPLTQESPLASPAVREDGLALVVFGNVLPLKSQHLIASISKDEPENLPHQARA